MKIKTLVIGAAFSGAMALAALSAAPAQALPLSSETGYAASSQAPIVDVRYKDRHWRGQRDRHDSYRGRHSRHDSYRGRHRDKHHDRRDHRR